VSLIAVVVTVPLALHRFAGAQQPPMPVAEKSRESKVNMALIEQKLEKILDNQTAILKNQQTILQRFDAVMEELRIIKMRATR